MKGRKEMHLGVVVYVQDMDDGDDRWVRLLVDKPEGMRAEDALKLVADVSNSTGILSQDGALYVYAEHNYTHVSRHIEVAEMLVDSLGSARFSARAEI